MLRDTASDQIILRSMIVPNAAAKTPTESSEELITISPTLILRAYANTPNAPLNSVVERMPSFLSCLKRKGKESSPSETSNLIHEDGSSSPSADDDHSSTNSIGDNVGGGKDISFWGGLALLVNSITGPGKYTIYSDHQVHKLMLSLQH